MRFDLMPDFVAAALQLLQTDMAVAMDAQLDTLVARASGEIEPASEDVQMFTGRFMVAQSAQPRRRPELPERQAAC